MRYILLISMLLSLLGSSYAQGGDNDLSTEKLQKEGLTLLQEWMDGMLDFQCHGLHEALDGGVICPACARMHGRTGDAVLPLMYLADKTGEDKYLDAATRLMKWMENVHRPDGSWMNDVNVSEWNGTTVFAAISLYEALYYHGHLLNDSIRSHWKQELLSAGYFMMENPFIYSRKRVGMRNMNVNYSASATYALYAIGEYCGVPSMKEKAMEIAADLKSYFTQKNCFLFGEGPEIWKPTANGCFPIDLLYNVEESLPNLAYYARMAGDNELLALVERSMKTHLEFMLPDGAWDNSWGTRSFKWTYWGGRTSDGFMGGYYALASHNPEFIEAIRRNLHLLRSATYKGLLYGGLHYRVTGLNPCIHHTFGHAKALASFLEQPVIEIQRKPLPRECSYGIKYFGDIRTWLVAQGAWRATITGYDAEYKVKGTHPMGGALSLLWHEKAGPIFAATMNSYQLIEAPNMQTSNRQYLMGGTPRIEMMAGGIAYTNLDDLQAQVSYGMVHDRHRFDVKAHLVDIRQKAPNGQIIPVGIRYSISDTLVSIEADLLESAYLMLPIISPPVECVYEQAGKIIVQKENCRLKINCRKGKMMVLPTDEDGRIVNPVPGFAFLPIKVIADNKNVCVEIEVE